MAIVCGLFSPLVKLGLNIWLCLVISVNLELNEKNYFTELLFFSLCRYGFFPNKF